MNFTATTRKAQGTGASRRLRRENKLPGIVYGNDQAATPIVLDHNPIFYALRKEAFHSSVLTLNLDGVDQLVVLRSFQLHPYKQQVLHIDFQRVDPNKPMNMRVPLHFAGAENSPAVKISKGLISHLVSFLEVHCLPKDLPEFIDVDLSNMTAQTILRASDLNLPAGVTVVEKPGEDTPIAHPLKHTDILRKRRVVEGAGGHVEGAADAAAAAAASAAAAPAEGAAAPAAAAEGEKKAE